MPTIFPAPAARSDQTETRTRTAPTDRCEDSHSQAYQTVEMSRAAARNRAPMAQPQASFQSGRTVPKARAEGLARALLRAALTIARSIELSRPPSPLTAALRRKQVPGNRTAAGGCERLDSMLCDDTRPRRTHGQRSRRSRDYAAGLLMRVAVRHPADSGRGGRRQVSTVGSRALSPDGRSCPCR